jgi:hypothetical protein
MIYVTVPDDVKAATATIDKLTEVFEDAVRAAVPAASVGVDDWEASDEDNDDL